MELIERIRKESRAIHDRLEGSSGVDKIMDGSVTDQQVQEILLKNYLAFAKAEQEITPFHPDHLLMSHRILADLDTYAVEKDPDIEFNLENKYQALGARYVLNGSMLGASIIGKRLRECENIKQKDWQFYRKPSAEERNNWPQLLKEIQEIEYTPEQQEQIISGVLKTFRFFEKIYTVPRLTAFAGN